MNDESLYRRDYWQCIITDSGHPSSVELIEHCSPDAPHALPPCGWVLRPAVTKDLIDMLVKENVLVAEYDHEGVTAVQSFGERQPRYVTGRALTRFVSKWREATEEDSGGIIYNPPVVPIEGV